MTGDQIASLSYLALLGGALALWYFVEFRQNLGRSLKMLAAWMLIFVAVIAAVGLWGDIRQASLPRQAVFDEAGRIELPRQPDGHYYATLDINGVPVRFVVDTGATSVVLSRTDAARAGIDTADLAFLGQAQTANGVVATAPVMLETVALGPFRDTNLRAFVTGGQMETSLLGMSYLQRYARLEIAGGRMVLER